MRSRAPHKDPVVITHGLAALREMHELSSSLRLATLLTDDGFEVVSVPITASDGRMASMASSIQALSEAVASELDIGTGRYVIIAAEDGHAIQLRVPGQQLVLAGLFDGDETLGKALATSRVIAEKLSATLASTPQNPS